VPGGAGVRCCPSSLYTFPAGRLRPGLARDCHVTGFPEFGQFCIAGFPASTQVFPQVRCVCHSATPAHPVLTRRPKYRVRDSSVSKAGFALGGSARGGVANMFAVAGRAERDRSIPWAPGGTGCPTWSPRGLLSASRLTVTAWISGLFVPGHGQLCKSLCKFSPSGRSWTGLGCTGRAVSLITRSKAAEHVRRGRRASAKWSVLGGLSQAYRVMTSKPTVSNRVTRCSCPSRPERNLARDEPRRVQLSARDERQTRRSWGADCPSTPPPPTPRWRGCRSGWLRDLLGREAAGMERHNSLPSKRVFT